MTQRFKPSSAPKLNIAVGPSDAPLQARSDLSSADRRPTVCRRTGVIRNTARRFVAVVAVLAISQLSSVLTDWPGATANAWQDAAAPEGKFGSGLDLQTGYGWASGKGGEFSQWPVAVECWVKLRVMPGINFIVSHQPLHSANHWSLYTYTDGVLGVHLPGFKPAHTRTTKTLRDDAWHHIAMVMDGRTVTLYIDGSVAANQAVTPVKGLQVVQGSLMVGTLPGLNVKQVRCRGLIDNLRLWEADKRRGLRFSMTGLDEAPRKDVYGQWSFDARNESGFPDASRRLKTFQFKSFAQDATVKRPVPPSEKIEEAAKVLEDLIREGLVGKETDIATALLKIAGEPQTDDASRYAIYQRVLRDALTAGNFENAMAAANRIIDRFAVNAFDVKADALLSLTKNLRRSDDWPNVTMTHLDTIAEAIPAGRLSQTEVLLRQTDKFARLARNVDLLRHIKAARPEIDAFAALEKQALDAMRSQADGATDKQAAQLAGVYLALVREDLVKARTYMLAGTEHTQAITEYWGKAPDSAEEMLAQGDHWYSVAEALDPPLRRLAMKEAEPWYRASLLFLDGLPRAKVEVRLKTIAAIPEPPSIRFGRPVQWWRDRKTLRYRWYSQKGTFKGYDDAKHTKLVDGKTGDKRDSIAWQGPNKPAPLVFDFKEHVRPTRVSLYLVGDRHNAPPSYVKVYSGTDRKATKLLADVKPPKGDSGWLHINLPRNSSVVSRYIWLNIGAAEPKQYLSIREIVFE